MYEYVHFFLAISQELTYPKNIQPVKAYYEDDNKTFSRTKFKGIMYKNLTLLKREYMWVGYIQYLHILFQLPTWIIVISCTYSCLISLQIYGIRCYPTSFANVFIQRCHRSQTFKLVISGYKRRNFDLELQSRSLRRLFSGRKSDSFSELPLFGGAAKWDV